MPLPAFLLPAIGMMTGAGIGAAVNGDNRGKGALMGGLLGLGAGAAPAALGALGGGAGAAGATAAGVSGIGPVASGATYGAMLSGAGSGAAGSAGAGGGLGAGLIKMAPGMMGVMGQRPQQQGPVNLPPISMGQPGRLGGFQPMQFPRMNRGYYG